MSDVIDLRERKAAAGNSTPETLKSTFGDADAVILQNCAEWRIARAEQQKIWAANEIASVFGHAKAPEVDLEQLNRMRLSEHLLTVITPRTIQSVREMIRVCITILAHKIEDAEATLSEGPVLEILQNVVETLEYEIGTKKIGKGRKD